MTDSRGTLYTTPEMAAAFSAEAHIRGMLRFESALAHAEVQAGIIPPAAAVAIRAACEDAEFDTAAIYRDAAPAGTPVIPLVRMLTEQVADSARGYVHWGATSQDAIDTSVVLQMREGLHLLETDLMHLAAACAALTERHRNTLMTGRTLLQGALPIPFGLKTARWLGLTVRQARATQRLHSMLALQFGGAAGTLAALGNRGLEIAELLAAELHLPVPDGPWHAERDRPAAIAACLGVTAGAMAKIAQDIVLLGQSEVGEVAEGAGPEKGGSSAMPQKRNPVDSTLALAAARLAIGQVPIVLGAMMQEHERGAGGWQAEWEAIPDLFCYTGGAVARVREAVGGLEVDERAMRRNLERSGDLLMAEALSMALAPHVGRQDAQRIVGNACSRAVRNSRSLGDEAMGDDGIRAVLSPDGIAHALDPDRYLGSSQALIDRALEDYRRNSAIGEK